MNPRDKDPSVMDASTYPQASRLQPPSLLSCLDLASVIQPYPIPNCIQALGKIRIKSPGLKMISNGCVGEMYFFYYYYLMISSKGHIFQYNFINLRNMEKMICFFLFFKGVGILA